LLAFSLVVGMVCAVGFGLAPALRASRVEPGDVLRDQSRASTGGAPQLRLREMLVASQVALAFVLLVGAGLLLASLARIQNIDLGIKSTGALTFEVHLPDARYDSTARDRLHQTLDRELASLPGVVAAGATSRLPATGKYHQWGTNALSGPNANTKRGMVAAEQRIISGDYFKAVSIPLIEGRLFDSRDVSGTPNHVIVSRSLAQRLFPGVSAIGQQLRTGGRTSEIVGVVGDVAVDGEGSPDTYVYHPHMQYAGERNWSLTEVVRTTGSLEALTGEATRALHALDPLLVAYRPTPLADAIGQNEAQRKFILRMLMTFSLVALALAALGQFGVLSYGVRLRTREFGIRMALGAERGAIRRMVLRRGLVVTALGTAIGLVAACALSRVMTSMLFHVSPVDPVVLAGATVFMLVVSGIAVYLPARGATAIDPRATLQ
jgi:predicted permease